MLNRILFRRSPSCRKDQGAYRTAQLKSGTTYSVDVVGFLDARSQWHPSHRTSQIPVLVAPWTHLASICVFDGIQDQDTTCDFMQCLRETNSA